MIEDSGQDDKSRSQVKREFRALKELGIRLARLPEARLRAMPLSEKTRDALLAAKSIARNSLQRQYRYLASLLAEEDAPAVRAALTGELQPHVEAVAKLHEAELWRDRLLAADECELAAFMERYPECDRTQLRRLVRNAKKERDQERPPKSARELFRYLRQLSRQQDPNVLDDDAD